MLWGKRKKSNIRETGDDDVVVVSGGNCFLNTVVRTVLTEKVTFELT